jgi:hypothetical protein
MGWDQQTADSNPYFFANQFISSLDSLSRDISAIPLEIALMYIECSSSSLAAFLPQNELGGSGWLE